MCSHTHQIHVIFLMMRSIKAKKSEFLWSTYEWPLYEARCCKQSSYANVFPLSSWVTMKTCGKRSAGWFARSSGGEKTTGLRLALKCLLVGHTLERKAHSVRVNLCFSSSPCHPSFFHFESQHERPDPCRPLLHLFRPEKRSPSFSVIGIPFNRKMKGNDPKQQTEAEAGAVAVFQSQDKPSHLIYCWLSNIKSLRRHLKAL